LKENDQQKTRLKQKLQQAMNYGALMQPPERELRRRNLIGRKVS
jgi:hypothetical protein